MPTGCPKGQSAPAIGAVRPGRDEQRHVVMRRGMGDAEANRYEIEERRLVWLSPEVVAYREYELVLARAQVPAADQRLVGAAVGVGDEVGYVAAAAVVVAGELDRHAGRGPPARGVEHMRGEKAAQIASSSRSRAILAISAKAVSTSRSVGLPNRASAFARIEARVCSRTQMTNGKPKRSR